MVREVLAKVSSIKGFQTIKIVAELVDFFNFEQVTKSWKMMVFSEIVTEIAHLAGFHLPVDFVPHQRRWGVGQIGGDLEPGKMVDLAGLVWIGGRIHGWLRIRAVFLCFSGLDLPERTVVHMEQMGRP